ncbi:orotidine 5'-phosphate decarboxylase [Candidatus Woesearchaeota archaeon]|nr:orotidine 5'-phosphate decarboxylase [Candidatus Woesearchaeota archaeon]
MRDYAIVLSNDVQDKDKMLDVCRMAAPFVDAVKIGITSSMKPGVEVFEMAKKVMSVKDAVGKEDSGVKVLADYKVADIGFYNDKKGEWQGTNEKIVRVLSEAGADFITCHTIVGISSIQECVETAHKYGSGVFTLPFMTHKGAELIFYHPINKEYTKQVLEKNGFGAMLGEVDRCETMCDLILAIGGYVGVDGFIGPANNPEVLKRYREFTQKPLWTPGIGRQDKSGRDLEQQLKDWAKIVGPNSGAIIGSAIYGADDPAAAAKEIMEIRDRVVSGL